MKLICLWLSSTSPPPPPTFCFPKRSTATSSQMSCCNKWPAVGKSFLHSACCGSEDKRDLQFWTHSWPGQKFQSCWSAVLIRLCFNRRVESFDTVQILQRPPRSLTLLVDGVQETHEDQRRLLSPQTEDAPLETIFVYFPF